MTREGDRLVPLSHTERRSDRLIPQLEEIRVPREIEDSEGIRWSCAQAYAGLSQDSALEEAARVEGTDRFRVICTPSGGSRSVELELPGGWDDDLDDDRLLELIHRSVH